MTKQFSVGELGASAPARAHAHDELSNDHCSRCPVRMEGFCARLSRQTLKLLSDRSVRATVAAGQPVSAEHQASEFGLVISGFLRRVHYGLDGKRQVVSLTTKSKGFSLSAVENVGELEAATDVEICRIRTSSYRQVLRDCRDFREQIFREAQDKMDVLHTQTCLLAALSPERRIAAFLTDAIGVMPWQPLPEGGGVLTVELSRTDIADYLGTTFESISRITQKFHRMGLIRIQDPYHFEIPDPEALARFGGLVRGKPVAAVPHARASKAVSKAAR